MYYKFVDVTFTFCDILVVIMSSLRRSLSLRKSRRSYKTLSVASQSTIKEEVNGAKALHLTKTDVHNSQENKNPHSQHCASTPMNVTAGTASTSKGRKTMKQRVFPSLDTVKSALGTVKQVIKSPLSLFFSIL